MSRTGPTFGGSGDRLGIFSPDFLFHPDPVEIEEAAVELEELGYGTLYASGWNGGAEVFPSFRRLLAATDSIPVVSAIVNVWGHSPEETAAEFEGLEHDFPGRFQLGLGIGHPSEMQPGAYRKPAATMRAFLDGLDRAVQPVPRERRLIAALGPRMLSLARERASGSVPYFIPVDQVREIRERLGSDATIAVGQRVLLEDDPVVARELARASIAPPLALTNYSNNLLRHGFEEGDLLAGGSDRLVDAMVAWGDEEAISGRVAEYRAAGADHVWFWVDSGASSEHGFPLAQWRRLAALN